MVTRLCLAVLLLSTACGGINRSWRLAYEDEDNGRWESAYTRWRQIVDQAEREHYPNKDLAVYYHNLGRTAGATCRFAESEAALLRSVDLYACKTVCATNPLLDLARLNLDQRKFEPSLRYFQQWRDAAAKLNVDERQPAYVAYAIDDYALALDGAGDAGGAQAMRERAAALRKRAPNPDVPNPRTPYGAHCPTGTSLR